MTHFQLILRASLLAGLATSAACGSHDNSGVVADGKSVSSVEIGPNKTTMTKGATLQFTATVQYADGTSADVTTDQSTVWNTSEAVVATVSKTGLVTTVSEGIVDITAEYKGATGDEHFAVTP